MKAQTGVDRLFTFHSSPTARANKSSPAMTLPAITPTGTSPFSPGLLTVSTTWTRRGHYMVCLTQSWHDFKKKPSHFTHHSRVQQLNLRKKYM